MPLSLNFLFFDLCGFLQHVPYSMCSVICILGGKLRTDFDWNSMFKGKNPAKIDVSNVVCLNISLMNFIK